MSKWKPHQQQFVYLCQCGCGKPTLVPSRTDASSGYIKGQPLEFIRAHRAATPEHLRQKIKRLVTVTADGCWEWTGLRDQRGYGRLGIRGKDNKAHRVSYEVFVGPINAETLDHLCANPPCVNPEHLEPVSVKENILRYAASVGHVVENGAIVTCARGHRRTSESTRIGEDGRPVCRVCRRAEIRMGGAA